MLVKFRAQSPIYRYVTKDTYKSRGVFSKKSIPAPLKIFFPHKLYFFLRVFFADSELGEKYQKEKCPICHLFLKNIEPCTGLLKSLR